MITKYPDKKLSKCSKEELILLLQSEIENREKLIKRIEKAYSCQSSKYDKGYIDGMKAAGNLVKNFYHYEEGEG